MVCGPLLAPAPVDVEVGEDSEQPGAHVRAGRIRLPRPERALVRLLDEILRLAVVEDLMGGKALATSVALASMVVSSFWPSSV